MAIYDENGVPQLKLSNSSKEFVDGVHGKALAAIADPEVDARPHYLVGEVVIIHCKEHAEEGVLAPGVDHLVITIGGSTLQEALTEVIGSFDFNVAENDRVNPPDWVASTHEDLANLLAEHYDCKTRDINKVG